MRYKTKPQPDIYGVELQLNIYEDVGVEWVAFVDNPKLKYISGVGSTMEEACKSLEEALKLYYDYIKEKGE